MTKCFIFKLINMKKIYLDYAATTPVDKKVVEEMLPYFSEKFGNPSSIHQFGQEAMEGVDKARSQVAEFLNCSASEVIFTSGATESNNLTIKGLIKATQVENPHIITSVIEHHCVLNSCETLQKDKMAEVSFVKVNKEGIINPEDIKNTIKENTVLVSVMYGNNEVGIIQPIAEIGKVIKEINQERENQKLPKTEIWAYQIYSTVIPNVVINVTKQADKKRALLHAWKNLF